MSRLILSDAVSILGDDVVMGFSVFPLGANDGQKVTLLNRALERLVGMQSWRGIDVLSTFTVYNNQITLPRSLQSVKKAAVPPGGSGLTAVPVQNMWFQFHLNGPGLIDTAHPRISRAQFVDIGLGFVTFLDPTAPFKIKIVGDVNETASTDITFFGTDASGNPIYTGTELGETLDCNNSPATTTQTFSSLTRVIKAVTLGRIKVYAVDAATNAETLMAIYDPGETSPSYRRYQVTGSVSETRTFTALCKRAHVKLVSGNDEVEPDNINALGWMLRSIGYSNTDDGQKSDYYEAKAVKILNDELGEYMAETSPAIQIQLNAFAGAAIRNLR